MELALIEVLEGRLSIYKAAKQFKIPYGSIHNNFHGRHFQNIGAPTVLTAAEEAELLRVYRFAVTGGIFWTEMISDPLFKCFFNQKASFTNY